MTTANLATVFGPTLLCAKDPDPMAYKDENAIVEVLISQYPDLFNDTSKTSIPMVLQDPNAPEEAKETVSPRTRRTSSRPVPERPLRPVSMSVGSSGVGMLPRGVSIDDLNKTRSTLRNSSSRADVPNRSQTTSSSQRPPVPSRLNRPHSVAITSNALKNRLHTLPNKSFSPPVRRAQVPVPTKLSTENSPRERSASEASPRNNKSTSFRNG